VDFTPTEEQVLLRETARRLLANECPPSLVRAHIGDRSVAGREGLWRHLAEWTDLGNGPLVDLCVFLEEAGAACVPGPFLATTLLYAPLVGAAGGGGDGTASGTVAMAGADGQWAVNAEPVKTFVLEADVVDAVAFVVAGPGGAPAVGVHPAAGLALRPVLTLDGSRRIFEVGVPDDLTVHALDPVAVDGFLERAWVGLAAELLGTSRWLFDQSLAYAKQREQFGRPIGSFQAIQHKLANMALARERAWAAVYYAAMTVDAGDDQRRPAAHVAKATASEAAHLCANEAIQIHGGIGFTYEHDLHLWMRRAYGSERLLGTADWHHDRLADLILT
jgi:alkylation response protein AidB-like acyl-CoA dehydrogenase